MNKRRFFFAFLLILFVVGSIEFALLLYKKSRQDETTRIKQAAVVLTGLPDLALATEARYIRHRSLASVGAVFSEEGTLGDYFPSGFSYTPPSYLNAHARITHEQ